MIRKTSLLWPDGSKSVFRGKGMKAEYIYDLGVDKLIDMVSSGTRNNHVFYQTFSNLCTDPETLNYRLDVLDDFLNVNNLDNTVYYILESIKNRNDINNAQSSYKASTFIKIDGLLKNINEYLNCINIMYKMLSALKFSSLGFNNLTESLKETMDSPFYKYFSVFGSDFAQANKNPEYIAFGLEMGFPMNFKTAELYDLFTLGKASKNDKSKRYNLHTNFYMQNDLKDIATMLQDNFYEKIFKYYDMLEKNLSTIEYELSYFLSIVRFYNKFSKLGIKFSRPEFRLSDERITFLKNACDPVLCYQMADKYIHKELVLNDCDFNINSRTFVITGVNQGGKTTWLRMVGLAHVMAQAGLYVFAEKAVISPVDNILTVFASEEKGEIGQGKLAEDFFRIAGLFNEVTSNSLVLLNEALASTSQDDASYLIAEYLRILDNLGCRSAFVTHFLKVINKIDEINAMKNSSIKGLVSVVDKVNNINTRTYKIKEGRIKQENLIMDLAVKEGISYNQLISQ